MEIVKKKINEIKGYKHNAKLHPEWQIEQIKKSIETFGFNDPIAIDENNVIIEGHGRLLALKKMEYDEVECIVLSHMTDQEKKAYILAHNKINMNTGFDDEILKNELNSIKDINLSEFGFSDFEVDDLMTENEEKEGNYTKK